MDLPNFIQIQKLVKIPNEVLLGKLHWAELIKHM
jgi:hypothetical protein